MQTRYPFDWATARRITIAAALLVAIVGGARNTLGLVLSPINTATGLGLASISFAWAASQLVWGVSQPVTGWLAARYGPARVIAIGALMLAASTALLPIAHTGVLLTLVFAAMAASGTAVGGTPILLGIVMREVPPHWRGLASGLVGAGASAGQLVLAPAVQATIAMAGWVQAIAGLAVLSLAALPLARMFVARSDAAAPAAAPVTPERNLAAVMRDPRYWLLTLGFSACGFHVGFLFAHMPDFIALCGLPAQMSGVSLALLGLFNVAGSVASGIVMRHVPMTVMLSTLYALRALGVILLLALPKTTPTLLAFSVWMGLTYFAVLPPTAGLIGRLSGPTRFAAVFGVTMLVHQAGSFLGVWLGGLAVEAAQSYDLVWKIDVVLALAAAKIHALLRQPRMGTLASLDSPGARLAPTPTRS